MLIKPIPVDGMVPEKCKVSNVQHEVIFYQERTQDV